MQREGWQATALILAALWVATTAAAFITKRQLIATEQMLANEENERCPVTTEQVVIREPAAAPTYAPPSQLRGNERCIAGQLFRRDGNAWSNVGRC